MSRPETNPNILPMAQEEPPELSRSAHVRAVAEFVSKNNRHYHKVEFADGKSVTVFDAELAKSIRPNMDVEYTVVKNERSGYWDLKEIHEAPAKEPAPTDGKPADPSTTFRGSDRDRQMMSMNCLSNSTNLVIESMKVSSEFVEPRPFNDVASEALSVVKRLHAEMMALHEAPKANGNRTQQGEIPQSAAG